MKQHLVALLSALILSVSVDTLYALHSDPLIDWNDVLTTQENPFGSFEDNLETVDDITHTFNFQYQPDSKLKKRKRIDEENEMINVSDTECDPRKKFDSHKIITTYTSLTAQQNSSNKMLFECICSPVKKLTISSLSGLERHFSSATHVRYMKKKMTPLVAYDAQQYIATDTAAHFTEIKIEKNLIETALKFVKKNRYKKPVFAFNEKDELVKVTKALEPTSFTCICDPESSFTLFNTASLIQHINSDKHTAFRKRLKQNAAVFTSGELQQSALSQEESDMIERARITLKDRLENGKYECPCGSLLTVEGAYVLRDHFKTKKHTTNIHNVEKELRAKGIIR